MDLPTPLLATAVVALAGVPATCALCFDRAQIRQALPELDRRLVGASPYLAVVGVVLVVRRALHEPSLELSLAYGWNVTHVIYAIEGLFVAQLQAAVPGALTPYFAAAYMIGFPYLLVAPVVAYLLSDALGPLKELLVAYALNYLGGTVCYTLFVAYGPRVHLEGIVREPMYSTWPETQEVTAAVSANTNVFPSLHTSLAVVVLLFAWHTRRDYPRWFGVAAVGSASVVLSTMVLGIHWLVDVVAGVGLAVASVLVARRIVAAVEGIRDSNRGPLRGALDRGRSRPGD